LEELLQCPVLSDAERPSFLSLCQSFQTLTVLFMLVVESEEMRWLKS